MFLSSTIPLEIRLLIYAHLLNDHKSIQNNQQPSNAHIVFLHTSRQIEHEAGHLSGFRAYLSLRYEHEIVAFLDNITVHDASKIFHVDVANDGRLVQDPKTDTCIPVSRLHLALQRLPSLRSLRVFDCHRVRALHEFVSGARFVWSFENAMFPNGKRDGITSYQYFIAPSSKTVGLHSVYPIHLRRLRLSGFLRLYVSLSQCMGLRHLTIDGVTGNYFDQRPSTDLSSLRLESFQYRLGHRLGFEIRDQFLQSIVLASATTLRRLILLDCSKLSSKALATSLPLLQSLEYFAMSFVTVHEIENDFVAVLPLSLQTLKLKITHALYAKPLLSQEEVLCNSLESVILNRDPPLDAVYLELAHVTSNARALKWFEIASRNHFVLQIGPWESYETI